MGNALGKAAYKPLGFVLGSIAGLISGLVFKKAWEHFGPGDQAPDATDEDRRWGEVLVAAALQGAIFALTRAAVDRATATGIRKVTGQWPS